MRLGQLSRKLELSTSKIVTFIEKEFEVTLENHPNTKIDDSFLEKIESEFKVEAPEPVKEVIEKVIEVKEEVTPVIEIVKETEEEVTPVIEEVKATIIETVVEETLTEEKEVELIKAPKPELKQIKVLRKIELPTKKVIVKEVEEENSSAPKTTAKDIENLEKELAASINKPTPLKKKESTYKRPNKPMKKTKSIDEVLAEKKKREEKARLIEEKKQKEREEYEKKRKKEHYAAQLAKVQSTKKKKKKKVVIEETVATKNKEVKEKPKSWIGKLIHWFQTS
jgi:hypothetical protein